MMSALRCGLKIVLVSRDSLHEIKHRPEGETSEKSLKNEPSTDVKAKSNKRGSTYFESTNMASKQTKKASVGFK